MINTTILRRAILAVMSVFFVFTTTAIAKADNYGAIAVSPSSKALGWSYDYKSIGGAKRAALANCRKHAGDCKIANWFRNSCGAIAVGSNGGWGADWGNTIKQAKWKARKKCRQYDSNCKAIRWVCTTR